MNFIVPQISERCSLIQKKTLSAVLFSLDWLEHTLYLLTLAEDRLPLMNITSSVYCHSFADARQIDNVVIYDAEKILLS